MLGRLRERGDRDTEALVGDRLRSILAAAAAPHPGWVPEPLPQTRAGLDPRVDAMDSAGWADRSDPAVSPDSAESPVSAKSPAPAELGSVTDPRVIEAAETASAPAPGRHRGGLGRQARVRWDPGRPGALALCLVAVLAAALSAGLSWWSRPQPSAAEDHSGARLTAVASTLPDGQNPPIPNDAGSPTGSAQRLVVSVIGEVRLPGLVTVDAGARVADAIAAAGGTLPDADLSTVNLARLLVDGEQIAVGVPGSSAPGDASPSAGGLVDLNTASQPELEQLPGIGPVLAQRIIDFREENAGFSSVEQLREVSGIGPTVYDGIVDLVTV